MPPILEVSGLSYSYHTMSGETKALSDISFQVETGEFIAIVRPSGCGKSTLLSLISGLLPLEEGSILINGVPLSKSQCRIGYMLQSDQLFEWRTIIQNAALGLEIQKNGSCRGRPPPPALKIYGLEQFEHSRPSELSGGMRQRAALIRTLALEPELLLLDEPFSALDYQTRLTVCDDISTIIRESRKTAILITHDLSEAVSAADRILVLTKRPGTICRILPVTFPLSANRPLERRNDPAFSLYFNELWKTLQGEGKSMKCKKESTAQKAYLRRQLHRRRLVLFCRIFLFVFFLICWEMSARLGLIDAFIFSSPSRTVRCFLRMMRDKSILIHTGVTLYETLISFTLVILCGLIGAILLWSSRNLSEILEPYLVMLNSLPKSALAPILIVWLGSNIRTIIVASISVAVFGSILTLHNGFSSMDPDQIKLIRSLGGNRIHILTKVLLPGSIPLILANMKVNIGLCLVGVIISEFLAAKQGLGYLIIYGSQVFQMDMVVMSIILYVLCLRRYIK